VGLKPTYGLVSRYGLVAFASSLDQIGPFTRSVEDAALCLSVIGGHDERDSTSAVNDPPPVAPAPKDLKGLRVGLPREYFIPGLEPEVEKAVRAAVETLKSLGATVKEVSLPHTKYAIATYYILAPSEASSNLARFDGIRYGPRLDGADDILEHYEQTRGRGFGPEVKRRIMLGTYALASGYYDAYYLRAQKVRTLIRRDFEAAFAKVDFLISPTSPSVAFRIGERVSDPLSMYLSDVCTIPVSLAGLPAVSIPCGLSEGLPVGLQIAGPAFSENRLLDVAHALEGALGFDPSPPGVR
jgi:aspartyl-tRNA(Asn)/glutamyl-tRNA(Gln) amidotransferase subunit A